MADEDMKNADPAELFGRAAPWGASFLFVRMGAAESGRVALAALRVTGASLFLIPLLAMRSDLGRPAAAGERRCR